MRINNNLLKLCFFILFLICLLIIFYSLVYNHFFTIETLKQQQAALNSVYNNSPIITVLVFSLIYVLYVSFSIPGASFLTLAAGSTFGFIIGTITVALACTTGAMFSLLISRFFLKDYLVNKYSDKIEKINTGLEHEGITYILILRLLPVFPFFLVNLLLGVTSVRVKTFFLVSLVGMLPGIMVYINAGSKLAQIHTMSDIFTPTIVLSLMALGLLPLCAKFFIDTLKKRTKTLN